MCERRVGPSGTLTIEDGVGLNYNLWTWVRTYDYEGYFQFQFVYLMCEYLLRHVH